MRSSARRGAMVAAAFVVAIAIAGGVTVFAGDKASDEAALQPVPRGDDGGIEHRIDALISQMTLEEKLEQIQLLPDFLVTDDEVRNGLGSVLSVTDPQRIRELQRMAVEDSRLGIPLLFAFDTIHGFRTTFPIPLGTAASFDPDMAVADATLRRARVGGRGPEADLRADGRRLARAALGPDLRGRRRGPVPERGARRGAREGDPGHLTTALATS